MADRSLFRKLDKFPAVLFEFIFSPGCQFARNKDFSDEVKIFGDMNGDFWVHS